MLPVTIHVIADASGDALSIYTTYIALNALCPVSIPDELRQQIEGTMPLVYNVILTVYCYDIVKL